MCMNSTEIKNYHTGLLNRGILHETPGTVWAQHNGNSSNPYYPWKMHLFADGYDDWYNLARVVIPYLVQQNATFKTVKCEQVSVEKILNTGNSSQFGKAFTIYPNNEAEFKNLAIGLNKLLMGAKLQIKPNLNEHRHNLAFERSLGDSGRIFYRAERDANGKYISASDSVAINPKNPYNPYNMHDPYLNLFDKQKSQRLSAADIIVQIKNLSSIQAMKNSADNNEGSYYIIPKNGITYAQLENLFKSAGIPYDIHFSRLMGRNVIRVLARDMNSWRAQTRDTLNPVMTHVLNNGGPGLN